MSRQHRQAALVFILITVFLDVLGLGIVVPVLPHLVAQMLGEDTSQAARWFGLLTSTYAVMQFVFSPLLGALSDRFGRRPVLLLSLLGMALNYLLMALAPSLGWLFLARLLSGVTGASFTTAAAYIADVTPREKRAQSFGLIGAMFGVGFVFGPALGGVLGSIDIRLPFYVSAGVVALNVLYGFWVVPESLPLHQRRALDWRRANPLGGLYALRHRPLIVLLAVAFVLASLAQRQLETVWVLYTHYRYGWEELQNGLALSLVGVNAALVQGGLMRRIVPRLGERRSVMVGLAIWMVAMIGYGLASQGWMLLAVVCFASFGAIAMPSIQAIVSQSTPPDEQGAIQGIFTSLISLTAIVAPLTSSQLLAGFTGDRAPLELPGAPFFAGALFLGVAWLVARQAFRRGALLPEPAPAPIAAAPPVSEP